MTVAPQAEVEYVTGMIQGIVQKGPDKWQVEVATGGQNPRRLWTKDAGLVQQISTMIGQTQTFFCGISHWTNSQNQPVRSLWINGMGQGAAVPQPAMQAQAQAAPPPMPQQPQAQFAPPIQGPQQPWPTQQPTVVQPSVVPMGPVATMHVSEPVREVRIMRQTATKVASILISHVPAEQRTLENVLQLSERLVAYYEQGLPNAAGDGDWAQHPEYQGDPGPQGAPVDQGQFPQGY